MFDANQLSSLKDKLKSANSFLILLPPDPDTDCLASALSLHLSLKQNGKESQVGCSTPVKVGDSHLFGIDQVKNNIGSQNLIISFDYHEDATENVSYDIDEQNKKFNLRIKPKDGAKPLDPATISYSYSGAEADLAFVLGVNSLEELGALYSEEKTFLDNATTVSLNNVPTPSSFASINLNTNKATSLSEATAHLLKNTGLNPTADAATNLYNQIITSTNNFNHPRVTADTFEIIAFLMRSGAQRTSPRPTQPTTSTPPAFFTPAPTFDQTPPPPSEPQSPPQQTPPKQAWQGPRPSRHPGTSLK